MIVNGDKIPILEQLLTIEDSITIYAHISNTAKYTDTPLSEQISGIFNPRFFTYCGPNTLIDNYKIIIDPKGTAITTKRLILGRKKI